MITPLPMGSSGGSGGGSGDGSSGGAGGGGSGSGSGGSGLKGPSSTPRNSDVRMRATELEGTQSRPPVWYQMSPAKRVSALMEKQVPQRPILLSNITTSMDRNSFGITVKLIIKGKEVSGHASGMLPVSDQARLSAEATLKAVTNSFPNGTTLTVAGVRTENLVDKPVVLVLVNILEDGAVRKTLVGASIVKIDPSQTAAYATLDALNRYFPQLQPVRKL